MKRPCQRQCAACPFRSTSIPGWVGPYHPHQVVDAAWHGAPFFCHSRTNYERPDWRERAESNGLLCRGFLLFRHRMLAPDADDAETRAAQARVVEETETDPASMDVMEGSRFVEHHTMPDAQAAEFMELMRAAGHRFRL
jgi:hypothetical protein